MKLTHLAGGLVVAVAALLFFWPAPPGVDQNTLRAAGLVTLAIGWWAFNVMPEHIAGLIFMLLVVLVGVATPQIVFSGFASATIWLVFGGLFIAEAVRETGLGARLAGLLLDRYTSTYLGMLIGVTLVATALTFLMPATVGRVLLLVPLLTALAHRVGFNAGSPGYNGLIICGIIGTYHSGTAVLPANAPNLVLAGAAETLYGTQLTYGEYFLVQAPIVILLKGIASVAATYWLFPAQPTASVERAAPTPWTAAERRLTVILVAAILLWGLDFVHHIKSGWIALGAALLCMAPKIGVMPMTAFNERIRYGPFFYMGAILALGGVMSESGVTRAVGDMLTHWLDLRPGADAFNFVALVLMSTTTGVLTTNPAQPALIAPLAGHFAQATDWSVKAVLMTSAVGFSTMIFPHMVPPAVVGFRLAGVPYAAVMRLGVAVLVATIVIILPLNYLWWHLIGYFQ